MADSAIVAAKQAALPAALADAGSILVDTRAFLQRLHDTDRARFDVYWALPTVQHAFRLEGGQVIPIRRWYENTAVLVSLAAAPAAIAAAPAIAGALSGAGASTGAVTSAIGTAARTATMAAGVVSGLRGSPTTTEPAIAAAASVASPTPLGVPWPIWWAAAGLVVFLLVRR